MRKYFLFVVLAGSTISLHCFGVSRASPAMSMSKRTNSLSRHSQDRSFFNQNAQKNTQSIDIASHGNSFEVLNMRGGSMDEEKPQHGFSKRTALGVVGINLLLISAVYANTFLPLEKARGEVDYAFFTTALACIVLTSTANIDGISNLVNRGRAKTKEMVDFAKFQRKYLLVHLISAFTDFMQGAYLYMIYETYGYSMSQTALLYLSGFLSSLLVGFSAGGLVDKYGRKRGVIIHLVLNAIQCLMLSVNNYIFLLFGRIISGTATSLLMTTYECWMVSEHTARGFAPNLLGGTFSSYVFGMGAVAVLSGVVAGGLVERGLGVTSPFNFCALVSFINVLLVMFLWNENYGDENASATQNTNKAFKMIFKNPKISLVGLIQALFEGVMMVFVFMWTPVLGSLASTTLNLGLVFATFMVSVMVGSSVFKLLTETKGPMKMQGESILFGALVMAVGSFWVSALHSATLNTTLTAFILFEFAVGVYFPVIGTMRAAAIPEDIRATVMNIFRILLNGIVVVMLLGPVGSETMDIQTKKNTVYTLCAAGLGIATVAQAIYIKLMDPRSKKAKDIDV